MPTGRECTGKYGRRDTVCHLPVPASKLILSFFDFTKQVGLQLERLGKEIQMGGKTQAKVWRPDRERPPGIQGWEFSRGEPRFRQG